MKYYIFIIFCIASALGASFIFPWLAWVGPALLLMVLWSKSGTTYTYSKRFRTILSWILGIVFALASVKLLLVLLSLVVDIELDPAAFGF